MQQHVKLFTSNWISQTRMTSWQAIPQREARGCWGGSTYISFYELSKWVVFYRMHACALCLYLVLMGAEERV